MNKGLYPVSSSSSQMDFKFVSTGKKGNISKVVQYRETIHFGLYNLGFGNETANGDIDDEARDDNGDRDKILVTVASTAIAFTNTYPQALIFAQGSTESRTRLYQMSITRYYKEISENFFIYGLLEDTGWEEFVEGKPYMAFIARRKN